MSLRYTWPAEWSEQEAVWMVWPSNDQLWPGKGDEVRQLLASLMTSIANELCVRLICPKNLQAEAKQFLSSGEHLITLIDIESDDVWCRDTGPLFVEASNGDRKILNWSFNAWGMKYKDFRLDGKIALKVSGELGLESISFAEVLEGGAIEVNGGGLLLTTESVLLNPNRGSISRNRYEELFSNFLGVDEVLWLSCGLIGDDTDGHVDNVARFVDEMKVLLVMPADSDDPNYLPMQKNLQLLQSYRSSRGEALEIDFLPLPQFFCQGKRLPASYSNFYIANKSVFVPIYNCSEDFEALEIIQRHFPGHSVKPFDCSLILEEGGAIHCLTQPQFA